MQGIASESLLSSSPEQLISNDYTTAVDIYSAGLILVELLLYISIHSIEFLESSKQVENELKPSLLFEKTQQPYLCLSKRPILNIIHYYRRCCLTTIMNDQQPKNC